MTLTPEALEHAAAALAIACNGGAWDTHYHERHKALWRLRVIAAMELRP